jgi:hypothetical protein
VSGSRRLGFDPDLLAEDLAEVVDALGEAAELLSLGDPDAVRSLTSARWRLGVVLVHYDLLTPGSGRASWRR